MQEQCSKVTELEGKASTVDLRSLVKLLPSRSGYAKSVAESVNNKTGRQIQDRDVYNCVNRQVYDADIFWALCDFVEAHLDELERQRDHLDAILSKAGISVEPETKEANGATADVQG